MLIYLGVVLGCLSLPFWSYLSDWRNAKSLRKPEGIKGWLQFKTGAKLVPTTTGVVSRGGRLRKYVARKFNLIELMTTWEEPFQID